MNSFLNFNFNCRRTVEPGPGAFLCSCHFVDGKKENGPTLFSHNMGKHFSFSTPEKRTRTQSQDSEKMNTDNLIEDTLDAR